MNGDQLTEPGARPRRARWSRLVDDALWGPESGRRLLFVQRGLALLIGLRIALGSYRELAVVPDALFDPVPLLDWLPSMPSATVILAIQVVGAGAAGLAVARRWPRVTYAVAWIAFLVLAGIRSSRGKVLHNDLLLLWVGACFLLAPAIPRRSAGVDVAQPSRAWGWPIRLGIVVTALVYWFAGYHKLRRSGPEWVFGDNMSWVMRWGPSIGSTPLPSLTEWVGDHHLAAVVSAGFIIAVELAFPLVIWHRWLRPWFAAGAVTLHVGTWLLLGLDYWAWALTVPLLVVDWPAALDRVRSGGVVRVVRRSPRYRGLP